MNKKSLLFGLLLSSVQLMWCPPKEENPRSFIKYICTLGSRVYIRHELTGDLRRLTPEEIDIYKNFQKESAIKTGTTYEPFGIF